MREVKIKSAHWHRDTEKNPLRVCKWCQKEFSPAVSNQIFCLGTHRSKYHYHNREETRRKTKARTQKRRTEYPEKFKIWYKNFLERNPGYRYRKYKEFLEKHPDYHKKRVSDGVA